MTAERARVIELTGEAEQARFGGALAAACQPPLLVFLHGDLGAGKTTLVRGLLHGLGHPGAVKSPTYTLIEPYLVDATRVAHIDLYRISDPGELEYLGLREWFEEPALILIEWPERGAGWLPAPDLRVTIAGIGAGRRLALAAESERGERVLSGLVLDFQ